MDSYKLAKAEILARAEKHLACARALNLNKQEQFYYVKCRLHRAGVSGFEAMAAAFAVINGIPMENARRLAGYVMKQKRKRTA